MTVAVHVWIEIIRPLLLLSTSPPSVLCKVGTTQVFLCSFLFPVAVQALLLYMTVFNRSIRLLFKGLMYVPYINRLSVE